MEKVILLRYGELHLKGKNRDYFESKLINDIKLKLDRFDCKFYKQRGRYYVSDFNEDCIENIIACCRKVAGLHSLSVAFLCLSNLEEILSTCIQLANGASGSFRVNANRADKSFELNSVQLCALAGGRILESNPNLIVDLHTPDFAINIDIREDGHAFVFKDSISCAGGIPLGSSGKGLLLLSGGLDSPVAGYMMLKRGLILDALHFHSYPYTNERAQNKVEELAKSLAEYSNKIALHMVKLTKIQEEIKRCCDERYSVICLRMIMIRVALIVAKKKACGCLISGESLGQVASQTLESLIITDSVATIPVFRPLIGMDKQDIIEIAKKIETYETSILPFEDCCTIFLPKHPITRPSLSAAYAELAKIPDLDHLIHEAILEAETKIIAS